jgi:hypothetical protein
MRPVARVGGRWIVVRGNVADVDDIADHPSVVAPLFAPRVGRQVKAIFSQTASR